MKKKNYFILTIISCLGVIFNLILVILVAHAKNQREPLLFFAGIFLLLAVIFLIKLLKKSNKEKSLKNPTVIRVQKNNTVPPVIHTPNPSQYQKEQPRKKESFPPEAPESYTNLDVEEFEFVCTLDDLTCDICGAMDGKHFPMSQYKVGVTAPPMHEGCRCCTAPYFDDMDDWEAERAARDQDGNTIYVPESMTYTKWKKKYLKNSK